MRILLALLLSFIGFSATAQNVKDIFLNVSDNGKPLAELLHEIEAKQGVDFIFDEKKLQALTVHSVTMKQRLVDYLDQHLAIYKAVKINERIIFIMDRIQADSSGLNKENYVILKKKNSARFSIEGIVLDGKTDEPLVGAQVIMPATKKGTLSDVNGNFNIDGVTDGVHVIDIQFVGYDLKSYILAFSPYSNTEKIKTTLVPESRELQSVTVTAERINENVVSQITGIEKMSIATIKSVPTFLRRS